MIDVPNACWYLLDRHVDSAAGDRPAVLGTKGDLTYSGLRARVVRAAGGLKELGLCPEQRLMICMADSPDFVVLFLAALRIGAVPVPVSTMLRPAGLAELLRDSRAVVLAVSADFAPMAEEALRQAPAVRAVVVEDGTVCAAAVPVHSVGEVEAGPEEEAIFPVSEDSPAFWLYTSGTTGTPKAAMHRHASVRVVCETYGAQVLGIRPDDRILSAAKAFFAYGLGNSVLFPLSAGAATILEPAPSRPDQIASRAREFGATLFAAGPTFFSNMLRAALPGDALGTVRLATSAGEPLPAQLYHRWTGHFGVEILDGIGMTEMLHIFLSNRCGQVRPGTTGVAVPGYDLRILDEEGDPVPAGVAGTLYVRGASTAIGYWSRYAATRQVFQGEWLRTGDTYVQDADGFYTCLGRTGDMLKASGIWVSPAEVEGRLLEHPAVAEAVVVAARDGDGLEKPVAFVVTAAGAEVTEEELVAHCRGGLPSFKRPRRVVFTDLLPTTPTGKVRRVELRATATALLARAETEPIQAVRP